MSEQTGLKAIIPSGKEIGFMVIRGFELFRQPGSKRLGETAIACLRKA